jgi:hypothetical protein
MSDGLKKLPPEVWGRLAAMGETKVRPIALKDTAWFGDAVGTFVQGASYLLRRAQRQEQFFVMRYGQQLEDWARQQIAQQHDRRRSVNLPAGHIGFRVEPTGLSVVDEQRLLAWTRQHVPSAIRTMETIRKTALTEHLKATGEVADGAEIIGGAERFFISTKNLEKDEGGANAEAE